MQDIMDTARKAGIIIPFISNDAGAYGNNVPGSGVGAVDIYGHDSYP
jgi:beta-galactosidase